MLGRCKNKFYVAHCLKEALAKQSAPHDGVEGSGVYVREIFHGTGLGGKLPMGMKRGVDIL
jgi:small subunit ribosomal protein S5